MSEKSEEYTRFEGAVDGLLRVSKPQLTIRMEWHRRKVGPRSRHTIRSGV
jgi:hypothetical protein